jgi:microcystin-dependent protein
MDPFLGEIKIVAFNFVPLGWAACDGQIIQITQNQALYALLGATYGGNGTTTFALPDLRGRVPLHFNGTYPQGPGGGEAAHVLTTAEMPSHTHPVYASDAPPNAPTPTGNTWATTTNGYAPAPDANMMPATLGTTGGQGHENRQPYLVLNFVIATTGIFPSRD